MHSKYNNTVLLPDPEGLSIHLLPLMRILNLDPCSQNESNAGRMWHLREQSSSFFYNSLPFYTPHLRDLGRITEGADLVHLFNLPIKESQKVSAHNIDELYDINLFILYNTNKLNL